MILYNSPLYKVIIDDSETEKVSESESTDIRTETSSVDSDLLEAVYRTNDLLTGIIFFMGLLFGLIGMTIFWNRFKGD